MSALIRDIVIKTIDFADSLYSAHHSPSLKDRIETLKFQVQTKVANIMGLPPPVPTHSPTPISEPMTGAPKTTQVTLEPMRLTQRPQNELIVDVGYNQQTASKFPVRSVRPDGTTSPKSPEEHEFMNTMQAPTVISMPRGQGIRYYSNRETPRQHLG